MKTVLGYNSVQFIFVWYIAEEECHQDWEVPEEVMLWSKLGVGVGGVGVGVVIQIHLLLTCPSQDTPIFRAD